MVILDRYEMGEMVGQGGSGYVYRAFDRHLQQIVAVKQAIFNEQEGLNAYCIWNEVKLLIRMEHQALPKVYDYFRDGEAVYMVTEFVRGVTLEDYVTKNGPMDQYQALAVMKELISVFCYLHSCQPPVIYCDLKPANIMMREDGRIKLIDFGAATIVHGKVRAGTPGFSAPELLVIDGRLPEPTEISDIYSLGAVFCFLLTAKTEYPLVLFKRNLPNGIGKIIMKCLQMRPCRRYANVGQLERDIDHCNGLIGVPVLRVKADRAIGAVLLMILSVGVIVFALLFGNDRKMLTGIDNMAVASSVSVSAGELPVTVRDSDGHKLLIKEGAVYQPAKDIILELPLSGIPENKAVIMQIVIYVEEKRYESRKFLIRTSNNN